MAALNRWRLQLVADWRNGLKWYSVHISAYSAIFNAIGFGVTKGMAIVVPLFGVLPGRWLFIGGFIVAVATGVSRFICQPVKTDAAE